VRISRPCYDKYWRCPGWAGGGTRYAEVVRCDGGSLTTVIDHESRWRIWRTYRCPQCGVYVLPYVIRYADPRWWVWQLRDLRRWWTDRS
jgi:hypothetical protein